MATIGLNIAGGEFGGSAGTHNSQYHYPTYNELKFYADKGVDFIRLPFKWERMQDALGGPLDVTGDLALLKKVLTDAAALGIDVIIDAHNYGRYNGVAIGAVGGPTTAQFADFWKKMAIELKDYPALAGYDLMNEPHDMPVAGIWKAAAQAATDAIREVDLLNTIVIEGDNWSGAHSWLKSNADLIINDPANNIIYQAHQYFDDNSSGTYDQSYDGEGAYANLGPARLQPFVDWLAANNLKGMIGEMGVPSNDPRWVEVMKNALDFCAANNLDVTAWAGGAWWGETYSMYVGKPGSEDSAFGDLLEQYYNPFDGFDTQGPTGSYTTPIVKIGNASASEGATMTFTVTRSGDLSETSIVTYATAKGTATSGIDFLSTTGTLSFAPGETTKTITVPILNDTLGEAPETLKVTVSADSNVRVHDALGIGTISDPASLSPVVAISDATANEADGTVTFTVSRSGTLSQASSVDFATRDGTALAGADYTASAGTVQFGPDQATASITIQITNDTLVEDPETLVLELSSGTNVTIADGSATGTITSEDVPLPPVPLEAPTVLINNAVASEVDGWLVFTITRSGDLSGASSVNYATVNGTALAGSDYTASAGIVQFAAGQAAATVAIQITNDTLVETSETLGIELSAGTNVTIAGSSGTGTIISEDVAPPPPVNTITGTSAGETITGTGGSDIINGLGGNDVLKGLGAADQLTGGGGSDRFIFDTVANAKGDVVTDFAVGFDKLDFRPIDANLGKTGDQKFTWLDTSAFTGKAGELREYNQDGKHFVAGDINGDSVADFIIEVSGTTNLTANDIFL